MGRSRYRSRRKRRGLENPGYDISAESSNARRYEGSAVTGAEVLAQLIVEGADRFALWSCVWLLKRNRGPMPRASAVLVRNGRTSLPLITRAQGRSTRQRPCAARTWAALDSRETLRSACRHRA
jgi:hypothetical protein